MSLRIIATGGTFDKQYNELKGQLTFRDSSVPEMIARARLTIACAIETLPLIDSLDMTDEYRQAIVAACAASPEKSIVVIHGTDTMRETAHRLGQAELEKTVVLAGAMIPYSINGSDALFNLGFAVAAAQLLPAGVHVAMNGKFFAWDQVRKNRLEGVFEAE